MEPVVRIRALRGEPSEMAALQRVLESAPQYAERVLGSPPGPAEAQSLYSILPEAKTYDDKFVFGVFLGDEMVGCADVIRGYPQPDAAWLGLLLVSERHQGIGIGSRAYALVEDLVRSWAMRRIRLAVVETNDVVLPFWRRMGFAATGERKPYRYATVDSIAVVLEKPVS